MRSLGRTLPVRANPIKIKDRKQIHAINMPLNEKFNNKAHY